MREKLDLPQALCIVQHDEVGDMRLFDKAFKMVLAAAKKVASNQERNAERIWRNPFGERP